MHGLLHDIGAAVIAATLLGILALWTRQPVILGYLLAGAVVGPIGFGLVEDRTNIDVISEIGLVLLLFVIGLEMDLKQVVGAGRQLLVVGFGQFPLGVLLGIGFFALCGWAVVGAQQDGLYLALVCGLSSTAIVVKLLYDKIELDTLPGRLTLGVLVVQDVFAILVLAFQPKFAQPEIWPIAKTLLATVALLIGGFVLSKLVLSRLFASVARSPEMVVALSIGWCALVAGAAGAIGLSMEMGALVAGIAISAFPYSLHVTAKTLPLRDFFLTLFFVSLGMRIVVPSWSLAGPVALIVAFTLVSRFCTVYPLLALARAGRRTCFLVSLNLAQISEFGLVIVLLGVNEYHHIGEATLNAVIYALAITAVLSSYAIRWNHPLFQCWDALLARTGLGRAAADHAGADAAAHHPVVLLGVHRSATALLEMAAARDPALLQRILAIDFNPETLRALATRGIATRFGDIGSLDTLHHAHLEHARVIISSIPDMLLKGTDNRTLVQHCRALAPHAAIIAIAEDQAHAERLRNAGASESLLPHALVGERLLALVEGSAAVAD